MSWKSDCQKEQELRTLRNALMDYMEVEGADEQSALRDLLTDIRHLCDERGLNIYKALEGSYEVYLEESQIQSLCAGITK